MVTGTDVFKLDGTPYNSPEFPRGGLAATFTVDVTHLSGSPTFTVGVEHRNRSDTSWSVAGTFSSITATGVASLDVSGLRELVRFKYSIAGSDPLDGVHFRMQAPSWRPD